MDVISKYTIRKIQNIDYDRLTQFFEDNNVIEVTRHFNPFPLNDDSAWRITNETVKDLFFISLLDYRIVGLCMLRGMEEGFSVPSFGILIDLNNRRKGLGRIMTNYALEEAARLGFKQIRLSVYANNKLAICLYESLGFKEISRDRVRLNDEVDEKIVMMRYLC